MSNFKPQIVIGLKPKKGQPESYPRGYFEINGELFKITTCDSKKEGTHEWATITCYGKVSTSSSSTVKSPFTGQRRK